MNNWGHTLWDFLHYISFHGYSDEPTEEERKNLKAFLRALDTVLPCPVCRKHYRSVILRDADLKNQESFARWVVRLHNSVNKRLGKAPWSFARAREKWTGQKQHTDDDASCACSAETIRSEEEEREIIRSAVPSWLVTVSVVGVVVIILLIVGACVACRSKK